MEAVHSSLLVSTVFAIASVHYLKHTNSDVG